MTDYYSTCIVVPAENYNHKFPWAITTKSMFPEIVIIPFLDGDTFEPEFMAEFPGAWIARLEHKFAMKDE